MNYINALQEALLKVHNKSRISDLYMFEDQTVPGARQEYEYRCKVVFLHPDLSGTCHPPQTAIHPNKKAAHQDAARLALSVLPLMYTQNDPVEYLKTVIRDLDEKVSRLQAENTALRQQVERLMLGNTALYTQLRKP